ncbi:unnamed protein product [Diamesa tonsa]
MNQYCCRICFMSEKPKLLLLNLKKDEQFYSDMVKFIAGIEISENDLLPKHICLQCIYHIEKACEIKQKCIDADGILRQQLKDDHLVIKTEPQSEELILEAIKQEEIQFTDYHMLTEEDIESDAEKSHEESREFQKRKSFGFRSSSIDRIYEKQTREKREFRKPELHDMQCFLCNEKFPKIRMKEDHVRNFHNDERVCGTCGERFKAAISLERHVKSHIIEPEHMCHMCGKKYQLLHRLNSHIRSKHTESSAIVNEYICDICGYNIKHRGNLTRHMKTRHMKITGFRCNLCSIERTFTTKNSLDQHIYNTHKVEAPFKCVACNPSLRRHKKTIHENLKPFKCPYCEKSFGQKTSLDSHRNTHTGEKPYSCKFCDYRSGDHSTISKHQKQMHPDKQGSHI